MVNVRVLYWRDAESRFIFEDRVCTGAMKSLKPFDFGLEANDRIILVSHGFQSIVTYVNGKEFD